MVLYKYTNHYGIEVLRNLAIKITPFNELNDPLEITPYPKPVTKDDLRRPEAFAARAPGFDSQQQWYDRVERLSESELEKIRANQNEVCYKRIIHDASTSFGLLCLSATSDSILMWSHYSDSHRGMVIGIETDVLDDDVRPNIVRYPADNKRIEYQPFSKGMSELASRLPFTKGLDWKYEEEWRSICPLDHPKVAMRPLGSGKVGYFLSIPATSVAAVVLGYRCPVETEVAVKWLIRRNNLNVKLQKVRIDQTDQFRVRFEDIELK